MRVAIIGAGAVGCYMGSLLAMAGHTVTLLARPVQCDAIQQRGLILERAGKQTQVAVQAISHASALPSVDLVLFCVKSADTEEAGLLMAPCLQASTVVLSLQNGIDNAQRLACVLGHDVVPVAVYVAVDIVAPGHVAHHGGGRVILGPSAESAAIAELLTQAAIPATVEPDIMAILWEKLVVNCAYNALSALTQTAYAPMVATPGAQEVMAQLVAECVAVAAACGVFLPSTMLQKVQNIAQLMPSQMSSTAQDLRRGKPTEIDYLNGYVVRKGQDVSLPTPVNLAMQVAVKLAEKSHCLLRG
ncbi:ketopantoate reductase family protein [Acetobacter orientalis]|uniref:ketopantoate reductase family protein n=1 Tax=Acetobacter orientalis TaxID=146474 RepID=UPI0039EAA7B2